MYLSANCATQCLVDHLVTLERASALEAGTDHCGLEVRAVIALHPHRSAWQSSAYPALNFTFIQLLQFSAGVDPDREQSLPAIGSGKRCIILAYPARARPVGPSVYYCLSHLTWADRNRRRV